MRILSLVTKRSVRETEPKRRIKMFFTSQDFTVGDIIEIIDGNKKSPAYVYKNESAADHKQAIRSGELDLPKLKLSKTGDNAGGITTRSYDPKQFANYLADSKLAHATGDVFLKDFFPKKRAPKPKKVKPKITKADSFSSLSVNKYFGRCKLC